MKAVNNLPTQTISNSNGGISAVLEKLGTERSERWGKLEYELREEDHRYGVQQELIDLKICLLERDEVSDGGTAKADGASASDNKRCRRCIVANTNVGPNREEIKSEEGVRSGMHEAGESCNVHVQLTAVAMKLN